MSFRFRDTHSVEVFWNLRHLEEHLGGFNFHLIASSIRMHGGNKQLRLRKLKIVDYSESWTRWSNPELTNRKISISVNASEQQVSISNWNLDRVFSSNGWEKPSEWRCLGIEDEPAIYEGMIYSITSDENSATVKPIIFHPEDAMMEGHMRIVLVTQIFDLENRIKELSRGRRSPGFNNRGVSLPHPHNLPNKSRSNDSHSYDDDWYDDDGGRTPNDDRSDSMNPNSDRYNPGR